MFAIIDAIFYIINALLGLAIFLLLANAILSWLVAFDVINLRNRNAYMIANFLDKITRPILAPFQRFIPTFGGIDVSPIAAILVITALQKFLLPALYSAIARALA